MTDDQFKALMSALGITAGIIIVGFAAVLARMP
jgi:hypothetical protein